MSRQPANAPTSTSARVAAMDPNASRRRLGGGGDSAASILRERSDTGAVPSASRKRFLNCSSFTLSIPPEPQPAASVVPERSATLQLWRSSATPFPSPRIGGRGNSGVPTPDAFPSEDGAEQPAGPRQPLHHQASTRADWASR